MIRFHILSTLHINLLFRLIEEEEQEKYENRERMKNQQERERMAKQTR